MVIMQTKYVILRERGRGGGVGWGMESFKINQDCVLSVITIDSFEFAYLSVCVQTSCQRRGQKCMW